MIGSDLLQEMDVLCQVLFDLVICVFLLKRIIERLVRDHF